MSFVVSSTPEENTLDAAIAAVSTLAEDSGLLVRGRFSKLPRTLLHIGSKKEFTEPLRGFEHELKVHE